MSQSITSRRFPSTGGAKPDPVAIFNEERRVRGNQNTQQAKLRRSAEAKAKRERYTDGREGGEGGRIQSPRR